MLPKEYEARMKKLLNVEEFEKYLALFNEPANKGVVINTTCISCEEAKKLMPFLNERLDYTFSSFKLKNELKLGNTWFHHAGLIYLQEPSSMAPVGMLADLNLENAKVLDLCASPGGKSIDVYQMIGENGLLVSNEIVGSRSKILFSNIERMGFKNVIITNNSPCDLASFLPEFFDVVLVDAPCSGEGMFRKDENTILEWSEKIVEQNSVRQLEILKSANTLVKKGGIIVYSTCTFNTTENEQVINNFVKNYNYKICDAPKNLKAVTQKGIELDENETEKSRRFYPINGLGEGQFMCMMQKMEGICASANELQDVNCKNVDKNADSGLRKSANVAKFGKNMLKNVKKVQIWQLDLVNGFLKDNLSAMPLGELVGVGNLVMLCVCNEFKNLPLNYLSLGIVLGEIVKNRFEPHHHLFKTLGGLFKHKIELTEREAEDYLSGLELEAKEEGKGYAVVMHKGFVLGGVKIVQNRLKNYYPKGLRAKINKIEI